MEVTTHWDGRGWFTPGQPSDVPSSTWEQVPSAAWDLGDAERRDDAIARKDWKTLGYPQRIPAEGPFTPGSAEIAVGGILQAAPLVLYRHYTALSFAQEDAIVTVLSRHALPAAPRFDPVTDLEVFHDGYTRFIEELAKRPSGR